MISHEYYDLFAKDSVDKQLTIKTTDGLITVTNVELNQENFELTESICSESELKFGCCEASSVKFRISDVRLPLKDKWLIITDVLNGNSDTPFQIGRYKVFSDKPVADKRYRDIIAYDAMYDIINADVTEWYNTILPTVDSTVTMREFRTNFASYFGIVQENVSLANDSMIVEKTIDATQISGKDIITAICELNGCFGHIGRDGRLKYILLAKDEDVLYPSDDLYPSNDLYPSDAINFSGSKYISCQYEDYISRKITGLQIRQEEGDIGVIVGDAGNRYIVENNLLVYGKSEDELEEIATNLLGVIEGICYRPFSATLKGNPCFEVGDYVRFRTKYRVVETYILKRTLSGIQALRDVYEADGEEYYTEKVNSVEKSIIQLKERTNKLIRSVDETKSEITRVETETKEHADSVASNAVESANKATDNKLKNYSTTTEMNSAITQKADEITSTVSKSQTKWIIDEEQLPVDIYGYGAPAKETAVDNQGINYLDMETGFVYTTITNGEGLFAWNPIGRCEKVQDDIYSKIEQNAEKISQKVSNGEVVSQINQSADTIELKGDRIVIDSTKWKVDEDGSQECSDLTITGGNVDLESNTTVQTRLRVAYKDTESTIHAGDVSTSSATGNVTLYSDGWMIINANYGSGGNVLYIADNKCEIGSESTIINGNYAHVSGNFIVDGTKSRLASTENYSDRLLYCYETPSPMFGDLGEGKIDETGKCYIFLDDIFAETIDIDCMYQVFLQPYGKGDCYVTERTSSYFIVEGTENLSFGWELKAIQRDFDTMRLEEYQEPEQEETNVLSETYGYLTTLLYNPETEEIENE